MFYGKTSGSMMWSLSNILLSSFLTDKRFLLWLIPKYMHLYCDITSPFLSLSVFAV